MKFVVNLLVCGAAVTGLVAAVAAIQPSLILPAPCGEELAEVTRVSSQLFAAKHAVASDLIDGRLGLPEAVDRFRALNAESPFHPKTPEVSPAAACAEVLDWAQGELQINRPEQEREVMGRLNEEAKGVLTPG
jgi:hypothetical protein